jgi:hypothetical protein
MKNTASIGSSERVVASRSRLGCSPCKKRRVRCDQRKPHCSACLSLGHFCAYPLPLSGRSQHSFPRIAPKSKPDASGSSSVSRPIWSSADTCRNIFHDAFRRFDPVGFANSELWSNVVSRESASDNCYHHLCLAVGAISRRARHETSTLYCLLPSAAVSSSQALDSHSLEALKNYTKALSIFRSRLHSSSPRSVLLGTVLFSMFEVMRGNLDSSAALIARGIALLGDGAFSSDFTTYTGLCWATEPEGDVATIEAQAILLRCGAYDVLLAGTLSFPPNGKPTAIRRPKPFQVPRWDAPSDGLRTAWNEFAEMLESWRISCYWSLALRKCLDFDDFLEDIQVLIVDLESWERSIMEKIGMSNARWSSLLPLRSLLFYIRLTLLSMAWRMDDIDHPESMNLQSCIEVVRQRSRVIDGFQLGSWNEMYFDGMLIPILCVTAILSQEQPREHLSRRHQLAKLQLQWNSILVMCVQSVFDERESQDDAGFLSLRVRREWTMGMWHKNRLALETALNRAERLNCY